MLFKHSKEGHTPIPRKFSNGAKKLALFYAEWL
jgi:hypothetical protein